MSLERFSMNIRSEVNNPGISDRELRIIEEISRDRNLTQRKISRRADLSLGMTNLILKRLVSKGYVKIKGLDKRKVQYILTPKGFSEKARKSYRYFLKTIHSLKEMKEKIQELISTEHRKGSTYFVVLGDGELADVVELSLQSLGANDLEYRRVSRLEDIRNNQEVILLGESKPQIKADLRRRGHKWIDVLSAISGS